MKQEKENKKKNTSGAGTITVHLRYLRIAPRKVRLVANAVKHMHVNEAQAQLKMSPKRSSMPVLKLLLSGIAGAKNKNLNQDALIIKEVRVDEGPMLKRFLPRAMGRATPIHKKMSHITLVLEEQKEKTPRFIVMLPSEKKSKKKGKKETKEQKEAQTVQEQPPQDQEILKKEHEKEEHQDKKIDASKKGKGFAKRIFRRKSV